MRMIGVRALSISARPEVLDEGADVREVLFTAFFGLFGSYLGELFVLIGSVLAAMTSAQTRTGPAGSEVLTALRRQARP